jgi:NADP-dependent 3-hydroxy acid dehydrogenase YdfG
MTKVVLITGCYSGIGHATAHFFADEDWNVVAAMRHPEQQGTDLKDRENVDLVHLDVTDPASIREAVKFTLEKHGHIDVLVNNAGYAVEGVFEATTREQARGQFDTNVLGLMDVIREVLPAMREQKGGTIVNVSSIGGRMTFPMYTLYNSSKFAVEGFSESMSSDSTISRSRSSSRGHQDRFLWPVNCHRQEGGIDRLRRVRRVGDEGSGNDRERRFSAGDRGHVHLPGSQGRQMEDAVPHRQILGIDARPKTVQSRPGGVRADPTLFAAKEEELRRKKRD